MFKQFLISYLLQYNVKKLIIVEKSSQNNVVNIVAKILRGWYHFPCFYVESGDYVKK